MVGPDAAESIKITDNAIIPLKERVADRYYDPIQMVWRKLTGRGASPAAEESVGPTAAGQTSTEGEAGPAGSSG
jgi:hypothetical protein